MPIFLRILPAPQRNVRFRSVNSIGLAMPNWNRQNKNTHTHTHIHTLTRIQTHACWSNIIRLLTREVVVEMVLSVEAKAGIVRRNGKRKFFWSMTIKHWAGCSPRKTH